MSIPTSTTATVKADDIDYPDKKVALVTGSARRLGAEICRQLHARGYHLAIHCNRSVAEAGQLAAQFNGRRPHSAVVFTADLTDVAAVESLAHRVLEHYGAVDALVNNASSFYPTPLASADEQQWEDLIGSNLKGPFFLCRALADTLASRGGRIVNIADIHARQPIKDHPIYCIAKAGNIMLTKSLALELAPSVQVNGIAPGAILWPESGASGENSPGAEIPETKISEKVRQSILQKVPLQRTGTPADIAALALFLLTSPGYITGQVVAVDGGRSHTFC